MTDDSIHARITDLVDTERRLRDELSSDPVAGDEKREQLRAAEVELDRLWDLLRQRDAQREFGRDPDEAQERSARTVENYRN